MVNITNEFSLCRQRWLIFLFFLDTKAYFICLTTKRTIAFFYKALFAYACVLACKLLFFVWIICIVRIIGIICVPSKIYWNHDARLVHFYAYSNFFSIWQDKLVPVLLSRNWMQPTRCFFYGKTCSPLPLQGNQDVITDQASNIKRKYIDPEQNQDIVKPCSHKKYMLTTNIYYSAKVLI